MKVAMVASSLSRKGGGVSAVVEALSCNVAACGIEARVFGLEDEAWIAGDKDRWGGAPAVALPVVGPKALGYAPSLVTALVDWAPDVVHIHGIWMYPCRSVLQWSKLTGRSYLISPHGMLAPAALRFSRAKKRVASMSFQARAFAAAACVHATCEAEVGEIRAYGLSQPVAIFPNGIDAINPPPSSFSDQQKRVLSLGRIHPKKGLDRLFGAWAHLENEFPDWQLDVVGPSESGHAEELDRLARKLGLRRVMIRGPVYGENKHACLAGAELFALPTLNENFALAVAESLACGTPVISTKGAPWQGLEEHHCGWWIDHGIEPLAKTLRYAMSLSPEDRRLMGKRGQTWMREAFSWPAIAADASKTYRWMAKSGPAPDCIDRSLGQNFEREMRVARLRHPRAAQLQ